jgi:acetylornithine deacetylase
VVGWQRNPYEPSIENGQLFGLGSNDAGASLVTLLGTFWHFQNIKLPFNLIFAATAEEEISGKNGIASILSELGEIALAIVGEPTQMQLAIAEKGLMVLDGIAKGKAGHAARNEGINAIDIALQDVVTIQNFQFEKTSNFLGNIKATVTQIQAGTQHNVVPDTCQFVVDVRTNEQYSNKSVFELLQEAVQSELIPRSFRLNSSGISPQHPLVQRGIKLGLTCYGSPTLSDQALMPFPSVKIGPGDSARSHTADEFIRLTEIEQGLNIYKQLLLEWVI